MNINGTSIFMGAYAERRQQEAQLNPKVLNVSDERQTEIIGKLKKAMQGIDRGSSQSAKVSISQEDMDFLCSEAGFEKMKKDAEDLYIKNAQTQKRVAAGRDETDVFWKNTGNQWMIFSEYLYNNDFYTDMTDEEVQEMEKSLAQITAGMDHLSRSQYTTGMEFSDYYGHGANYFMSSGEVLLELESSTSALRYFADKYVSEDKKEQFGELIDQYHSHNTEIIGEYVNPMESFSKMVHGIHSGKYPGSSVLNMSGEKVDEYKYTVMSGGISKTEAEKAAFQKELAFMFDTIGQGEPLSDTFWEQMKDKYLSYVSGDNEDESFKNYIWDNSIHTVNRIQNYWSNLGTSKANKILAGKTADELQASAFGIMRKLSEEEVREMHEKARSEQRTLTVDSSEIVNNVYSKTGNNITYNVDGVSFSNEEMQACKEIVKNAIAALPTKGSDLDYEDYAAMGIAANMVSTYAKEHLTEEQADVVNKSMDAYWDSLVQAEKERHNQSGYQIDDTEGVGNTGDLNKYYAVRQQLSDEAVESLKSQLTSNLPENIRNTLLANLEHARKNGSVVQSASNEQLADMVRALFQNMNLKDSNEVINAYAKYREVMTPVYMANGIKNNVNSDSLSNVLGQDVNRFSVQIANAKAVLSSVGSSLNITV